MNHEKLSQRLAVVASFVPKGARLADIGSDHAYLPTYLMLQDAITFAVAGEVVTGPFESAKKQVVSLQLEDRIAVRLADGLQAVTGDDAIDTVTICGMGGDLIASILEAGYTAGKLDTVQTLILQPNVDAHSVREWLMQHDYHVTTERIIEENHKIYEIIVAELKQEKAVYTSEQIMFGVYLPMEKSPAFIKKWQLEIEKYDYILQQLTNAKMQDAEKVEAFKAKKRYIQEVLNG